ncbi:hypothetical protein ACFLZT_07280, partial [Thermodesulfobacteriota bacterium]
VTLCGIQLEMYYSKRMEVTGMEDANIYSEEDIYKAYDMGLLFAIDTFESAIGFSPEGQLELVEKLKKTVPTTPFIKNTIPMYKVK